MIGQVDLALANSVRRASRVGGLLALAGAAAVLVAFGVGAFTLSGYNRQIAERKTLNEQLAQTNRELEKQIAEKRQALQEASARLATSTAQLASARVSLNYASNAIAAVADDPHASAKLSADPQLAVGEPSDDEATRLARELWRKGYAASLQPQSTDPEGRARRYFQQALAVKPNFAWALNSLGVLDANNKKFDEADKYYQAAMKSDPSYPFPFINSARVEFGRQNYQRAGELVDKALELRPDYPEAKRLRKKIESAGK